MISTPYLGNWVCRHCGNPYKQTRARVHGYCTPSCQTEMAKKIGWRPDSGKTELEYLKNGCIGHVKEAKE